MPDVNTPTVNDPGEVQLTALDVEPVPQRTSYRAKKNEIQIASLNSNLAKISDLDDQLTARYADKLITDASISRQMVSFQANKQEPIYRWYKYKEGFSSKLVQYLLASWNIESGCLLDPFAGSGASLFAAAELGLSADGIELLPIGQQIIEARTAAETLTDVDLKRLLYWAESEPWRKFPSTLDIPSIPITQGAYSEETANAMAKYICALRTEPPAIRSLLRFALLCVLESISFTRKDGQYLRWDARANRINGGKLFNKGTILPFRQAIKEKIAEIITDMELFDNVNKKEKTSAKISLLKGSCFAALPKLADAQYDVIFTSPPYCNRYDYTRTYALELALLGVSNEKLRELRQEMLTCTVENRAKNLQHLNPLWAKALDVADNQPLLQSITAFLDTERDLKKLNNSGIARMVRGYFNEMAVTISECARVLKKGARIFMVNDNVRYAGANISVDLILSDIASKIGFEIENILVLPTGKGNSSQQMGVHGRTQLRKCVYVWKKL